MLLRAFDRRRAFASPTSRTPGPGSWPVAGCTAARASACSATSATIGLRLLRGHERRAERQHVGAIVLARVSARSSRTSPSRRAPLESCSRRWPSRCRLRRSRYRRRLRGARPRAQPTRPCPGSPPGRRRPCRDHETARPRPRRNASQRVPQGDAGVIARNRHRHERRPSGISDSSLARYGSLAHDRHAAFFERVMTRAA